ELRTPRDDQDVGGDGAGRGADQRVDVQGVQGVAQVAGEAGQRDDRVGGRVEVGGGLAAGSGQDGGDTQAAEDRPGLRAGDGGKHDGPFGKNLYKNPAGADHHQGSEGGVADQAQG